MRFVLLAVLSTTLAGLAPSSAQTLGLSSFAGAPSFSWWDPDARALRGDGSFARMSTGFEVVSSKRFGTTAGPTLGFEGGRMWQSGDLVYGVVGGFDVMRPLGSSLPAFGRLGYERDFSGAVQVRAGSFVSDNVLVYAKLGVVAVNETWRYGWANASPGFSRSDVAFGPDARVGVEWAITEQLSVSLEAGVTRPAWR